MFCNPPRRNPPRRNPKSARVGNASWALDLTRPPPPPRPLPDPPHNDLAYFREATAVFSKARHRAPLFATLLSLAVSGVLYGAGIPIVDDFEDGDAADGDPFTWLVDSFNPSGTREVVNGEYVFTATDQGTASSFVEETLGNTGDVSVRTRLRIVQNVVAAGVFVRGDEGSSYFAGINGTGVGCTGCPFVGETNGEHKIGGGRVVDVNQDVEIQLDVIGNTVSFTNWPAGTPMPATPTRTFTDFTPRESGSVGVWINSSDGQGQVVFREFEFIPALAPAACDFNDDGLCRVADIDLLVQEVSDGTPSSDRFDLDSNGSVDNADVDQWLLAAAEENGLSKPYVPGDSNLDGAVDAGDLNNLALNWRQNVASWSGGDFTANGVVDSADLNELALNWRQSIAMASPASAAVAEPAGFFLLLLTTAIGWPMFHRQLNSSLHRGSRVQGRTGKLQYDLVSIPKDTPHMKLTAVFMPVPEGYVAFVEELPGANTQGATLDEARENLKEAVQMVLDANRELAERSIADKDVTREPFEFTVE